MYLVRISAPAPCGRNRGAISPGRVRTATPYFSDCPNQCAALYLVRILSAARCAGFRQAKSPGRVGRCRIPQRKSLRRMSGAFSLCLRCFPLSDRVQPGQRMYLEPQSSAPCGRLSEMKAGIAKERTARLLRFPDRFNHVRRLWRT